MATRRDWLKASGMAVAAAGLPSSARTVAATTAGPADADEAIAAVLGPIRKAHDLPALAGAIVTTAGPTRVGAVGLRRYGDGPAVTPGDTFHLGSCTKAMTATLLATFVDEGALAWDATLADALPDLAKAMRPEYRKVTVEQLLAQRSGFAEATDAPGFSLPQMHAVKGPLPAARRQYAGRVLAAPPAYAPGSKFVYSNRNYVVAGIIAERLGKASWEDLIKRRLFEPLTMTTAGFGAAGDPKKVDQPWPHEVRGGRKVALSPGPNADNPALIGPAGTVHASLADWGKFVACHLNAGRGTPPLLKPETFAKLHTPPPAGEYAFGWIFTDRDWAGGTALTHAGSNTLNYALVWMAPRRGLAFLAATNTGGDPAAAACDEAIGGLIGLRQRDS